jgi:UDP-MurNAc hydroxylase
MRISVLSHACLLIETKMSSVIVDPWLVGSCYWRSWWNFPEPHFDISKMSRVDAVVLSHIHWDHWHGVTLKKLFKGKKIYVPDEPGIRSEKDLRSIGFTDVCRVPHSATVNIGDIKMTVYQFGLHLNDAALVFEADGVKLLNANDAKIAGWPLQHLLSRHGRFDFALRSHSSANSRVCFRLENSLEFTLDDQEHYFRSFCAFMDVVKPRFAIPFASNHCHLHSDVYKYNALISNPLQLRNYVTTHSRDKHWSLKVMLPGSSWSVAEGFSLRNEACYQDLEGELALYRKRIEPQMDEYRRYESAIKISDSTYERFLAMFREVRITKRAYGQLRVTIRWPNGTGTSKLLSIPSLRFESCAFSVSGEPGIPNMIFPAVVFRDAVIKNMFHHAGISKRCEFVASSEDDLRRLHVIVGLLEGLELGRFPFRWTMMRRLSLAYLRRWREVFVYAQAFYYSRIRRQPIYIVEEIILKSQTPKER